MPDYKSVFNDCDAECPECGALVEQVDYVMMIPNGNPLVPDEKTEGSVEDSWHECLDCGWLDSPLGDLPRGAREDYVAAWSSR